MFQGLLFVLFLGLFVTSCIDPPYPRDLVLQHVLTVLAIIALVLTIRRFHLSNGSTTLLLTFMSLHLLGARYLYSYVPYDAWAQRLVGSSVSDLFGFERNHYDRLVHFGYGLLLAYPVREFQMRCFNPKGATSYFLAVEFIVASSALYELVEWLVALTFAPDWADRYLGQQGDIWDGQKDMALATAGAILCMATTALWEWACPSVGGRYHA